MHHWVVLHRMLLRLGLLVGRLLLLLLNKLLRRHMLLRVVLLLVLLLLLLLVLLLQALVQTAAAGVPAGQRWGTWHTAMGGWEFPPLQSGSGSAATHAASPVPQTSHYAAPVNTHPCRVPPAQRRTRCCGLGRPVSPPEGCRRLRPAAAAPLASAQTASC